MSYEDQNGLNDLDVAEPLDGASPAELLLAFRQLKAVVKNALLTAHYPDGRIRAGAISDLAADSVGTTQLVDGGVTAGKLSLGSVTTDKLADVSVTAAKLADGSLSTSKFVADSIPASAYKVNTIPLTALAGFVTREYLSSHASNDALRAVTAEAVANNAVTDRAVADVAFGKLTGGADSTFLFKVAGAWSAVALSGALSYNTTTNLFEVESGVKACSIADTKSRGTAGGVATAASWNLRTLGEVEDPYSLISFSSNKFTLLVGKYLIYIVCPASGVGKHQARLFNVTDTEPVAWGASATAVGTGVQSTSTIFCVLDVTDAATEYEVQHYIQTSVGANDLGLPASSDNTVSYASHREVYTQGFIAKIG